MALLSMMLFGPGAGYAIVDVAGAGTEGPRRVR
jgi:hypothetical protein